MDGALPRLILENDQLRAVILPTMGGKVGSLRVLPEDAEFLQQPLRPYGPRTRTMAFEEGDASGYDECIPSVSVARSLPGQARSRSLITGISGACPARCSPLAETRRCWNRRGFSLPLRFRKTIHSMAAGCSSATRCTIRAATRSSTFGLLILASPSNRAIEWCFHLRLIE